MRFEDLMNEFAAQAGLGELTSNDDGTVTMSFDGAVVVFSADAQTDAMTMISELGELPERGAALFLKQSLEGNYLHRGTSGSTLAVNPNTGFLCVFRLMTMEGLAFETFVDRVTGFVNDVITWGRLLEDYRRVQGELQPDDDGAVADGEDEEHPSEPVAEMQPSLGDSYVIRA